MKKVNEVESWIVIANAQHAKIFSRIGKKNNATFSFVGELEAELDTNHEKQGRSYESVGLTRHGIEPRTDRRDVEKCKFAKIISNFVKDGEKQNSFRDLILVASPRMMEMLDKAMDKELHRKISEKLAKNIVDLSDFEVEKYLEMKQLA